MTNHYIRQPFAMIRGAAEYIWLALSTAGWVLIYFFQTIQLHYQEWQRARIMKDLDAAKREFEQLKNIK